MYKKSINTIVCSPPFKKTNKILIIILFILFALPIPFSLISWIGTLISVANIGMASSVIEVILPVLTMIVAGSYLISYIIALILTLNKRTLSCLSFLPIMHIVLFIILFATWRLLEHN